MRKDVGCIHCHKVIPNTESIYMVKDNIWKQTGLPFRSKNIFIILHINCLESLIGRKLESGDFTITPEVGYAKLKQHLKNVVEAGKNLSYL